MLTSNLSSWKSSLTARCELREAQLQNLSKNKGYKGLDSQETMREKVRADGMQGVQE